MIEFHKIWIDQCEATQGIRERFGVQDAARYLIGEKFFNFLEASFDHPEFAVEIPLFVAEIKSIFQPWEISKFFEDLESGKVVDPAKVLDGSLDVDEGEDEGPDEHDVMRDADKILLTENARRLLVGAAHR